MLTSEEKSATKSDVISACLQTTQDVGADPTTETIHSTDAPEDMVEDGRTVGATAEERGRDEHVEAEESETDDDEHSPAQHRRDSTSGAAAPSGEKVSSPESDEQEVVNTIAALSTEKPAPDDVGT